MAIVRSDVKLNCATNGMELPTTAALRYSVSGEWSGVDEGGALGGLSRCQIRLQAWHSYHVTLLWASYSGSLTGIGWIFLLSQYGHCRCLG